MIGTILGPLVLARTAAALDELAWVQVQSQGHTVEAVDLVGCKKGEQVLVISGEAVRMASMGCPAEYAVAAVLREPGNSG